MLLAVVFNPFRNILTRFFLGEGRGDSSPRSRVTIDVESKIRTAEENLISLPKKKTIVSVCTTSIRSYVCLFITRNHLLQQCLILDFRLGIFTENVYFA